MKRFAAALFALAATGALVVALPCSAQTPQKNKETPGTVVRTATYVEQQFDGNQVVTFEGDPLPVAGRDMYEGLIGLTPRVLRQGLIRPRVNFLPELLKTVENL